MGHVFYIHGFASSAQSTKAAFFADRLRPLGIELQCPDFNGPDFSTLTSSRMISQLEAVMAALPPGPVALVGSSMGGFVAFHAAVRQASRRARRECVSHPIDRLVLLAPAFEFGRSRFGTLDEEGVARWKESDRLDVFHHGEKRVLPLTFAIFEDAQRWDSFAEEVPVPTLIFQGSRDEAVEPAMVRRFAAPRPLVTLRMLDDDHLLMANIDLVWRETATFLGLPLLRAGSSPVVPGAGR
ncbi:MAG: YqiA/YcfP family alpha/beta fold hydrolase [Acidobacteriota bacterium]